VALAEARKTLKEWEEHNVIVAARLVAKVKALEATLA
jgi:hypothetical protein